MHFLRLGRLGLRWGSAFLVGDWRLKLTALLLATFIWAWITQRGQGEQSEHKFTAPVVLRNIPAELLLKPGHPDAVGVQLRTRARAGVRWHPSRFQVAIDLAGQGAGTIVYDLSVADLRYDNQAELPRHLSVLGFDPPQLELELEALARKVVPVRVRYSGQPAEGFALAAVQVEPSEAQVEGPASVLAGLASVSTSALELGALRERSEAELPLELPYQVRLAPGATERYRVVVQIDPNPSRVLIRDIPVRFEGAVYAYRASVDRVNAHLEGPRRVIEGLEGVEAVIDLGAYAPGNHPRLTPRIVLPEAVRVLEQWPIVDLFVLKRRITQGDAPRGPLELLESPSTEPPVATPPR